MSGNSQLPSQDQIDAWEMRVTSVGHSVLTDTEWRQLIDGYKYLRNRIAMHEGQTQWIEEQ